MDKVERASRIKHMLEQIAPNRNVESTLPVTDFATSWTLETFEQPATESKNALEKIFENKPDKLTDSELFHLEAIVLPFNRPVVFVRGDSYDDLPPSWDFLNSEQMKRLLGRNFPSIGRVNVPNSPLVPYAGTGFVVGEGLLMTNRHVAQEFAHGIGLSITYTPGDAAVGFTHEIEERDKPIQLVVTNVELIHPYWDMALLRVDNLPQTPLTLSADDPTTLNGRDIVVIGYPALDPRNDIALQNRIFGQVFNVKRLQPGTLRELENIRSFENVVNALTHDASTLGGNSGSAVVDIKSGSVIALHFAGEYLKANYAVPMYQLARDPRLASRLNFSQTLPATSEYDAAWQRASAEARISTSVTSSAPPDSSSVPTARLQSPTAPSAVQASSLLLSVSLPIQFTPGQPVVTVCQPTSIDVAVNSSHDSSPDETVVVDQDYSDRPGYDPNFLDGLHVSLPLLTDTMKRATAEVPAAYRKHHDPYELSYYHYSVYMNKARRTAWFSAANVDGKHRPSIGKRQGDRWYKDTRIPDTCQLTQNAFEHGIDRGHLTRREDTAWGITVSSALKANNDTFHFTNCSLQASLFNRGKDRWQGLEQFLLEQHAKKDKRRMIVITGPLFAANDPVYRNDKMDYSVRCPLQFWKICVLVREDGSAAATGFMLGQNEITDLSGFTEAFDVGVAQITIADLEKKTGLSFGNLAKHDHFAESGKAGELETVESPVSMMRIKAIRDVADIVI